MPADWLRLSGIVLVALLLLVEGALAGPEPNKIAVFAGLDKISATIRQLEIPINETRVFGALEVTPRVCYTRPATEPPQTTTFVEISELRHDGPPRRIFSGWMFASSPGLHGVEHPVYDVWLTNCKTLAAEESSDKQ